MISAATGAVVVIRFSSMGDCILTTGVLAELACQNPGTPIVVVTKPAFRAIFSLTPGVARVLVLDDTRHRGLAGLGRLAGEILALKPKRIVDLHGTLRSTCLRLWMLWLAPAISWSRIRKQSLHRRWLVFSHSQTPQTHITARYAEAALGQTVVSVAPQLKLNHEVSRQRSVALVPGAAWATKMWPIDSYVALAERLLRAGYDVQVLGGDNEAKQAPHFEPLRAQKLPGQLTLAFANRPLDQMAELLAAQMAVVANDTGLMHLATAVGTPVVAIFGPTAPSLGFAPTGLRDQVAYRKQICSPCTLHGQNVCPRGHHSCMRELSVDVIDAKLQLLLA